VAAERASLERRNKLLTSLEEAVNAIDSEEDLMLFIAQERNETKEENHPHKYAKALAMLDWDFTRRCV
jgi:hypothetical protein